jgi:glycosyltransferase involved in cell wall biosynthesis
MADLISILIPAFNAERWIGEAIDSAKDQTWPRREIIVVDDGSSDRTLAIARGHEAGWIKVVGQDHAGSAAARNRALRQAQGGFIQWLDADDVLSPDKIARQLDHPDAKPDSRVLMSSAWAKFYSRPERGRFRPSSLWQDLEPAEWITRKLQEGAWMAIESWLVSRKLTELAGPWDESLTVDVDGEYFCRVVSRSDRVVFVPGAESYCRTGNFGSVGSVANLTDIKLDSLLRSRAMQIDMLRGLEDSARTRAAGRDALQRLTIYYYPEEPELFRRASDLARTLGGGLGPPELGWKYGWIRRLLGWRAAKATRRALQRAKVRIEKGWDRLRPRHS